MKKLLFFNTILAAAVGLAGCNGTATNTATANNANAVVVNTNAANMMNANRDMAGDNSISFMSRAAQGGMAEVKMGDLAASKAKDPEVKQFGQKMVTDHTKANNDLKTVAAKENISLPPDVNAEQKDEMEKLSKLSGADFDKEYVKTMVEDHEKDVADFQKQADSGTNADVKDFAAKTLPVLKTHLEMIKNIQAKMK